MKNLLSRGKIQPHYGHGGTPSPRCPTNLNRVYCVGTQTYRQGRNIFLERSANPTAFVPSLKSFSGALRCRKSQRLDTAFKASAEQALRFHALFAAFHPFLPVCFLPALAARLQSVCLLCCVLMRVEPALPGLFPTALLPLFSASLAALRPRRHPPAPSFIPPTSTSFPSPNPSMSLLGRPSGAVLDLLQASAPLPQALCTSAARSSPLQPFCRTPPAAERCGLVEDASRRSVGRLCPGRGERVPRPGAGCDVDAQAQPACIKAGQLPRAAHAEESPVGSGPCPVLHKEPTLRKAPAQEPPSQALLLGNPTQEGGGGVPTRQSKLLLITSSHVPSYDLTSSWPQMAPFAQLSGAGI